MRLNIILILFLLLGHYQITAQKNDAFDLTYDKIWKETASENLDLALSSADSLYRSAQSSANRIRSLILIARLYQQKEELDRSIEYIQMAEEVAVVSKDYAWQTRANAYLAGIYRMMEQYSIAKEYCGKAMKTLPKIKDKEQANSTQMLLYQELGFLYKDQENYRQAIHYFQQAGLYMDGFVHNRDFNIMNNERLLGDSYCLLESYDTAILHYRKALQSGTKTPVHYVIGFIHKGMAEAELYKGNLASARIHLDKAEKIADQSEYLQLKESVYALSKDYYARLHDSDKLADAREKKDAVTGALLDKKADLLNKTYRQLEQRSVTAEVISTRKTVILTFILVLSITGAIYFLVYRKKKRLELSRFKAIIEQMKEREGLNAGPDIRSISVQEPQNIEQKTDNQYVVQATAGSERNRIMAAETEHKLLSRLQEFEHSNIFLEKGCSFTVLAAWMQTNTKYLSFLLNEHRGTDFNSYLNQLRINYITKALKDNPEWRQYKISVLAGEAGFSSHSQFTAVFKNLTGITPSAFISHLRSSTN